MARQRGLVRRTRHPLSDERIEKLRDFGLSEHVVVMLREEGVDYRPKNGGLERELVRVFGTRPKAVFRFAEALAGIAYGSAVRNTCPDGLMLGAEFSILVDGSIRLCDVSHQPTTVRIGSIALIHEDFWIGRSGAIYVGSTRVAESIRAILEVEAAKRTFTLSHPFLRKYFVESCADLLGDIPAELAQYFDDLIFVEPGCWVARSADFVLFNGRYWGGPKDVQVMWLLASRSANADVHTSLQKCIERLSVLQIGVAEYRGRGRSMRAKIIFEQET